MDSYEIFGKKILSNILLPELRRSSKRSDISSDLIRLSVCESLANLSQLQWSPFWTLLNGEAWMLISRTADCYYLKFPDLMICKVELDSFSIFCIRLNNTPDSTLRHLILDQVIPLVLSKQGSLILHMAVVKIGDIGVGFLGESGQGKSTLTAEFSQNGYEVISDDSVLVELASGTYCAVSNYPGIRLWDDSCEGVFQGSASGATPMAHYTLKKRIKPASNVSNTVRVPLEVLFVLENELNDSPAEVAILDMNFQEKLRILLESKFRLETSNSVDLSLEFETLTNLANVVQCRKIHYQRNYSTIGSVRTAISDYVQARKQGQ